MSSNAESPYTEFDFDAEDSPYRPFNASERAVVYVMFGIIIAVLLLLLCGLIVTVIKACMEMRAEEQEDNHLRQQLNLLRNRNLQGGLEVGGAREEGIELAPLPPARVRANDRRLSMEAWEGEEAPPPSYHTPT